MKRLFIAILGSSISLLSCSNNGKVSDAYGNFEATEVIVSAEMNGKIKHFDIQEGKVLKESQLVGHIDSLQLVYSRKVANANINAILSKQQDVGVQIAVLQEQRANLVREKNRLERLFQDGAATQKQLDDMNGQIDIVDRQIVAQAKILGTTNSSIQAQVQPVLAQIEQIDDQIKRCKIVNPIKGRVLTSYAEESEITAFGKPLYKIADTDTMYLRAYVSGSQLAHIKIGQQVEVLIDEDKDKNRQLNGIVSWISETAEFTPKIVQTKEERVNMVYAVKVRLSNDGSIKIGMPGEINFMPKVKE